MSGQQWDCLTIGFTLITVQHAHGLELLSKTGIIDFIQRSVHINIYSFFSESIWTSLAKSQTSLIPLHLYSQPPALWTGIHRPVNLARPGLFSSPLQCTRTRRYYMIHTDTTLQMRLGLTNRGSVLLLLLKVRLSKYKMESQDRWKPTAWR